MFCVLYNAELYQTLLAPFLMAREQRDTQKPYTWMLPRKQNQHYNHICLHDEAQVNGPKAQYGSWLHLAFLTAAIHQLGGKSYIRSTGCNVCGVQKSKLISKAEIGWFDAFPWPSIPWLNLSTFPFPCICLEYFGLILRIILSLSFWKCTSICCFVSSACEKCQIVKTRECPLFKEQGEHK